MSESLNTTGKRGKMKDKKKLLKRAGNLLTVLAILLIVRKMAALDIDYSALGNARSLIWMAVIALLYGLLVLASGWPWGIYVRMLTGARLPYPAVAFVMTKANLLKYLPGNVFQYVGRNELAVRENLKHSDVGLATVFEILTQLTAAGALGCLFYFKGFVKILREFGSLAGPAQFVIYGVLLLAAAGALLFLVRKKRDLIRRYLGILADRKNRTVFLKGFLFYVMYTLVNAGLYTATLILVLRMQPEAAGVFGLVGAFILAWIAGFVVLGAPGGIGIRELVMTFLVPQGADLQLILLGLVVYRLISISGDVLGFGFGCLLYKKSGKHQEGDPI